MSSYSYGKVDSVLPWTCTNSLGNATHHFPPDNEGYTQVLPSHSMLKGMCVLKGIQTRTLKVAQDNVYIHLTNLFKLIYFHN